MEYNSTALVSDNIAIGSDMDQVWVVFCGIMVFFMQAGFTMLEAGAVKATNIQNILFKNLMDACCASISFWVFGYAVAYGNGADSGFVGGGNFLLWTITDGEWFSWFFQFAFAATAATIVSGCVAERCTLTAYACYTIFLTAWVYPVVVHWIWDTEGWLSAFNENPSVDGGVIDFAGSGVVHMVGGFSGLMGAILLGPRLGRFDGRSVAFGRQRTKSMYDRDRMHQHEVGNNVPFQVMGMFFLWFGWYAFNCGSTLAANGAMELASKIAVNTTLGAGMGGVGCAMISLKVDGYWSMPRIVNGVLAGLVSITAPCSVVNPADSLIIGLLGSWVYYAASAFLSRLQIDDPLDAFAVHGAAGVWGMIATGIFATKNTIAYAGYNDYLINTTHGYRFGVQLLAVVMIILWVTVNIGGLFYVLKMTGKLRVDETTEEIGMDAAKHGGSATQYPAHLTDQSVDTRETPLTGGVANHDLPAVDEDAEDGPATGDGTGDATGNKSNDTVEEEDDADIITAGDSGVDTGDDGRTAVASNEQTDDEMVPADLNRLPSSSAKRFKD